MVKLSKEQKEKIWNDAVYNACEEESRNKSVWDTLMDFWYGCYLLSIGRWTDPERSKMAQNFMNRNE
jgi:hypothetical protein